MSREAEALKYAKEYKQELINTLEEVITQLVITSKAEPHKTDCYICFTPAIFDNIEAYWWIKTQKPSYIINTKFTKHPNYIGSISWWTNLDKQETINEKKRFLRHLINKLKRRK